MTSVFHRNGILVSVPGAKYNAYVLVKGAHRDFSTTSHSAQFHTQVKLQHRRFTLVKLQTSTFAASMQKQLPKLTAD